MRRLLLLAGFVLSFSALPGLASALTMLDPGGSSVNPIYVQDVTPPQLKPITETPSYFELRRQRNAPAQPVQPVTTQTLPTPTVIYVNNPAPTMCPTGYLLINGSCLTYNQSCQQKYGANTYGDANSCYCSYGYQWDSGGTMCIQQPSTAVGPAGGSSSGAVVSCDRMVLGQMTHLGFATPSDCDAKRDAAIEAYYKTPVAVSQPVVKTKAATPVSATIAAVAAATTTVNTHTEQRTLNWWQKFLMWLGGL